MMGIAPRPRGYDLVNMIFLATETYATQCAHMCFRAFLEERCIDEALVFTPFNLKNLIGSYKNGKLDVLRVGGHFPHGTIPELALCYRRVDVAESVVRLAAETAYWSCFGPIPPEGKLPEEVVEMFVAYTLEVLERSDPDSKVIHKGTPLSPPALPCTKAFVLALYHASRAQKV